jgi:hypothetical protein
LPVGATAEAAGRRWLAQSALAQARSSLSSSPPFSKLETSLSLFLPLFLPRLFYARVRHPFLVLPPHSLSLAFLQLAAYGSSAAADAAALRRHAAALAAGGRGGSDALLPAWQRHCVLVRLGEKNALAAVVAAAGPAE